MSTRELLELAALDAMGLLDAEERESFDTAFRAAPAPLQARVRKEQARFAQADHLLPPVEPPVGLRARVIAKVREAIAAVRGEEPAIAGTIGPVSVARSTAPFWRAACIGFATASVVLGVLYLMVAQENRENQSMITSNALAQVIQELGPRAQEILMAERLMPVSFTPAAPDIAFEIEAKLLFDPDRGEALLLCDGLPVVDGTYTLVLRSSAGADTVQRFEGTGGFVPVRIKGLREEHIDALSIVGPLTLNGPSETILHVSDA